VTFRVDAFPGDTFTGAVGQVRLQPTTVQNVVTYQTVINVPNPQLKLKPGMTANVNIEISRRTNALRVPTAATRFRPTKDVFTALKQEPPADVGRGGFPGGPHSGNRPPAIPPAPQPGAPQANARADGQAALDARKGRVASAPSITSGATTIDSLFGPLPAVESRGRAWLYVNKQLKPVSLRLGISDGTNTELLDDSGLAPGTEVVTNVVLEQPATTTGTGNANNPLMGPQRGRGGSGGGGGGGGRGRG
jgi:HlyD family secretion protein